MVKVTSIFRIPRITSTGTNDLYKLEHTSYVNTRRCTDAPRPGEIRDKQIPLGPVTIDVNQGNSKHLGVALMSTKKGDIFDQF